MNAQLESDYALDRVMTGFLSDHPERYKQLSDNPQFSRRRAGVIFATTYECSGPDESCGDYLGTSNFAQADCLRSPG